MSKYIAKNLNITIIEAIQFTRNNFDEIKAFTNNTAYNFTTERCINGKCYCYLNHNGAKFQVDENDYIIKNDNNLYVTSQKEFEERYKLYTEKEYATSDENKIIIKSWEDFKNIKSETHRLLYSDDMIVIYNVSEPEKIVYSLNKYKFDETPLNMIIRELLKYGFNISVDKSLDAEYFKSKMKRWYFGIIEREEFNEFLDYLTNLLFK